MADCIFLIIKMVFATVREFENNLIKKEMVKNYTLCIKLMTGCMISVMLCR
jgi:hypothetical protein